jgi:queuine tRNA-ribosyltransferase/7-cyano-7-deazaguanine tRNA-ribosyltransferase
MPKFKIIKKDKTNRARAGELITDHGIVETPAFIPVGTKATVKGIPARDLREMGADIVLGNTYHLHLRPGEDTIKKFGGMSKFMAWNGPTMTDSGGFQVFSLGIGLEKPGVKFLKEDLPKHLKNGVLPPEDPMPRLNNITEEGVTFQSHIDGSKHKLTAESSIEIQEKLGADLIVGFDDLESPTFDHKETKKSMEMSNRWLIRSKKAHKRSDQLLYGVTHGGQFEDLRIESAKFNDENFDAIALGGAHSNKKNMYEVIDWTISNVADEKVKHQLGIGEVDDIFEIVERGIDTFDCVIPTRLGRAGHVFVSPPIGNIKNRFRYDIAKSKFAQDKNPIDPNCKCMVCQTYSRGYINHLFRAYELLAYYLASYHNLYFMINLTKQIRDSIMDNQFEKLKNQWVKQ